MAKDASKRRSLHAKAFTIRNTRTASRTKKSILKFLAKGESTNFRTKTVQMSMACADRKDCGLLRRSEPRTSSTGREAATAREGKQP